MISRRELKMTARMRLSQADPSYLKVMVVYILAAVVVPQVAMIVVAPSTEAMDQLYELIASGIDLDVVLQLLPVSPLQWFLQQALTRVLQLYQLILSFGLVRYCLSLYRGEPGGPADLFSGFSMVGRVLAEGILIWLLVLAWTIGATIAAVIFFVVFASVLPLEAAYGLLIVLMCAFVVGLVCIMLNYALATLALADRPELGAMGAIQYSKNLMRGHKARYFLLLLSFFGWSLLCSLPLSLFTSFEAIQAMSFVSDLPLLGNAGFVLNLPTWANSLISLVLSLPIYLWLTPYMNTVTAGFYDALHSQGFQPLDPGATAWHP